MSAFPIATSIAIAPFIGGDNLVGPEWLEGPDAGELVATAQVPAGSGPLGAIIGSLSAGDVDLYRIRVEDWSLFSASTVNSLTTIDTQIFLFDASGNGIAYNDDSGGLRSALPAGNTLYSGLTAGDYLIAISQFNRDPRDGNGNFIFGNAFAGVFGPEAGAGSLGSWSGATGGGGDYRLDLTGAGYVGGVVPIPTAAGLGLLGLGMLAGGRKRR